MATEVCNINGNQDFRASLFIYFTVQRGLGKPDGRKAQAK
jgi:hypothetical protein